MNAITLKSSILQLAVQGKLVSQSPSDEPSSVFISRIQKEKINLIKTGILKKEKELAPITKEDFPYSIPSGWSWIRLGDYCERITDQVASGSFASLRENVKSLKEPSYAVMVKTADFANGFTRNLTYTDEHGYHFLENSNLFGGELILSNIGSIGKVFIVPKLNTPMTLAPNSVMIRLLSDAQRDYLYWFLQSPQGYDELMEITSGTAMKKFNKTDLKTILIPVPPIDEQARIVAKINALLPLVESYGRCQEELETLNKILPDKLRKSVLQEAILGNLVPNDIPEGEASGAELLQQILKERQDRENKEKGKKAKKLTLSAIEEEPWELPEGWCWCKLGDVGSWGAGATPQRGKAEYYQGGTIPWLKTGELNNGVVYDTEEKVTELALEQCSLRLCQPDDVLIAMYGATIGKLAIAGTHLTTNQACCACTPYTGLFNKFLFFFLLAKKEDFTKQAFGGAQPNISKEKIVSTDFPLPPLSIQHRIVEKIEEVFAAIDKLQD